MKGIILAGGRATRLHPITKVVSKQLLPIYDKPMIYYPLSVLMLAGIRDILVISTPGSLPLIEQLLGNGQDLGIHITYAVQEEPRGLPEAFILGEEFIGDDQVCLILGDNIFFGHDFYDLLKNATDQSQSTIFAYYVRNPEEYGVVEFDEDNNIISIKEKPKNPKSNFAVTGLYFFDNDVVRIAKSLKISQRGELEITGIINEYLHKKKLKVTTLGRGYAWLDTGTPDSLLDASSFIKTIEDRQGLKIGCIEEVAYRMNFINQKQLLKFADRHKTTYGDYLRMVANGK